MSVTNNTYKVGSTIATSNFQSFFNEIKDVFINMGHTYIENESDAYKHVFKLSSTKYTYCGYEAKLIISLPSTIYNYLINDTLPTTGTNTDLTYINYTIELSNGFQKSTNIIFSQTNTYAAFLNSSVPRYQTYREIQSDSMYNISIYSGIVDSIINSPFYYHATNINITSCKYIDFNTETENDLLSIFGSTYCNSSMLSCILLEPNIKSVSSVKVLTSPFWLGYSTNIVNGYIKDILISSTIEPCFKYKINNISYIPLDRNQHILIKE